MRVFNKKNFLLEKHCIWFNSSIFLSFIFGHSYVMTESIIEKKSGGIKRKAEIEGLGRGIKEEIKEHKVLQ